MDDTILDLIKAELALAREKHPQWPRDTIHQAAIVAEESGELVQAALQYEYEGKPYAAVRVEAIHTAATCIRLLTGR